MNFDKLAELKEKTYSISNSELLLDAFLNDILKNDNENYNKENALKDFEKIVDMIYYWKNRSKVLRIIEKNFVIGYFESGEESEIFIDGEDWVGNGTCL